MAADGGEPPKLSHILESNFRGQLGLTSHASPKNVRNFFNPRWRQPGNNLQQDLKAASIQSIMNPVEVTAAQNKISRHWVPQPHTKKALSQLGGDPGFKSP